jgi:hypothetical protein
MIRNMVAPDVSMPAPANRPEANRWGKRMVEGVT